MKYYVVWEGRAPGIYDSWEECEMQTEGFPGAKFKAFPDLDSATKAFRGSPDQHMDLLRAIASNQPKQTLNYAAFPDIKRNALAVDAACAHNPGPVEYRGVWVQNGKEAFRMGPFPGGSNNMGEFIALVHGLSALQKAGREDIPIYTDSATARSWLTRRQHKCTIPRTQDNKQIFLLFDRAMAWAKTHIPKNPVLIWNTERWGEIPADFGRK